MISSTYIKRPVIPFPYFTECDPHSFLWIISLAKRLYETSEIKRLEVARGHMKPSSICELYLTLLELINNKCSPVHLLLKVITKECIFYILGPCHSLSATKDNTILTEFNLSMSANVKCFLIIPAIRLGVILNCKPCFVSHYRSVKPTLDSDVPSATNHLLSLL